MGSGGLLLLVCEACGGQQQGSTVQTLAVDGHAGASQASEVRQVVRLGSVLAVQAAEGCSPLQVIPPSTTRSAGDVSPCFLAKDYSTQGRLVSCHQLPTSTREAKWRHPAARRSNRKVWKSKVGATGLVFAFKNQSSCLAVTLRPSLDFSDEDQEFSSS